MYEIFPNYFMKYYTIFKKYHLINVYGPENLLHKLTVALALGSPPCEMTVFFYFHRFGFPTVLAIFNGVWDALILYSQI